MKKVVLVFSNASLLTSFVLDNEVNGEIRSSENMLEALLYDQQIADACTKYKADLYKIERDASSEVD